MSRKFNHKDIIRILKNADPKEVNLALASLREKPKTTLWGDLRRLFKMASFLLQENPGLTPDDWMFPLVGKFVDDIFDTVDFVTDLFFETPSGGSLNLGPLVANVTLPQISPPRSKFVPTEEYDQATKSLSECRELVSELQKENEALLKQVENSRSGSKKYNALRSGVLQLTSWTKRRRDLFEKRSRSLPVGDAQKTAATLFNAYREFHRRMTQLL